MDTTRWVAEAETHRGRISVSATRRRSGWLFARPPLVFTVTQGDADVRFTHARLPWADIAPSLWDLQTTLSLDLPGIAGSKSFMAGGHLGLTAAQ